jgi:hypothetical protein
VRAAGSVDVLAGDLAAVVDRGRSGRGCARHVDPPEPAAPVEQEAVLGGPHRGRAALVGVRADHAAPVVDPGGEGPRRAGEIDPADAPPIAEESVESLLGVEVVADDLPAAVASGCGGIRRAGHVDLGEAAGVAHEALAAGAAGAAREPPAAGTTDRRPGAGRSRQRRPRIASAQVGADTDDAARAAAKQAAGHGCLDRWRLGGRSGRSKRGNGEQSQGQPSGQCGGDRRRHTATGAPTGSQDCGRLSLRSHESHPVRPIRVGCPIGSPPRVGSRSSRSSRDRPPSPVSSRDPKGMAARSNRSSAVLPIDETKSALRESGVVRAR